MNCAQISASNSSPSALRVTGNVGNHREGPLCCLLSQYTRDQGCPKSPWARVREWAWGSSSEHTNRPAWLPAHCAAVAQKVQELLQGIKGLNFALTAIVTITQTVTVKVTSNDRAWLSSEQLERSQVSGRGGVGWCQRGFHGRSSVQVEEMNKEEKSGKG